MMRAASGVMHASTPCIASGSKSSGTWCIASSRSLRSQGLRFAAGAVRAGGVQGFPPRMVISMLSLATTINLFKDVFLQHAGVEPLERCLTMSALDNGCQDASFRQTAEPDNMSACKRWCAPVRVVVHGVRQGLRGLQRLQPLAEVEAHRAQRPVLLPHGPAHAPWASQHRQVVEQQRQHLLDPGVPCDCGKLAALESCFR